MFGYVYFVLMFGLIEQAGEGARPRGVPRQGSGRREEVRVPRQALRTSIQGQFWKTLSTFDDECPRNGSKYDLMAPRTTQG